MTTVVLTSDDLFRDINATFLSTYRDTIGQNAKLKRVMRLAIPSSKRTERFGYYESPPTLDRIDRGEAVGQDAFKAIAFDVTNLTWGKAIGWHEEDMEDIQLSDFREVVQRLSRRAATLPEEIFFQILTASASARLLETIPNAPDGAALFSTTAGGSARFGATNGNLLTGTGVATAAAIRTDFWNAVAQFELFQDTEGEPLLEDDVTDKGITIIHGTGNKEVFKEAFVQGRTVDRVTVAGSSTSNTGHASAAAVTNLILDAGQAVTLWSTQRITGDDWFCFADAVAPKAIFSTLRRAPRTIEETRENSELARRSRILATILDMRAGFGVNTAYAAIKINN